MTPYPKSCGHSWEEEEERIYVHAVGRVFLCLTVGDRDCGGAAEARESPAAHRRRARIQRATVYRQTQLSEEGVRRYRHCLRRYEEEHRSNFLVATSFCLLCRM